MKYSKNNPVVPAWPYITMWQYTSTPLDQSYFYGDKKAWQAYATKKEENNTTKKNYHTTGKRFRALKDLVIKANENWQENTGMSFCKHSVFNIEQICHTKTTTHARIQYNSVPVFVTLHKDHVAKVE